MTVGFRTFGCRLNHAEALDLEARIRACGHDVAPPGGAAGADVIVVRGCSVTARAQRDCEKAIAHLRARFPLARIAVTGCLHDAQADDAVLRTLSPEPPAAAADALPMATSRAFLKIQDGCSGACTFCTVPRFRGAPVSIPFPRLRERACAFLRAGYREIALTGCNLALYRSEGLGLGDVLERLAELTLPGETRPVHRVRLGSLEPGPWAHRLLDVAVRHDNICRFLHLSLQSAAPPVLARMKRPYTREDLIAFCGEARARLGPTLNLGADVIAGFPGESAEDHRMTCDFAAEHGMRLHVFPYSERPGTVAATLSDALPRTVRLERARDLERIGAQNARRFARQFAGKTVEVCVERDGNGRTAENLKCLLRNPDPALRRTLRRAVVTAVDGDVLTGSTEGFGQGSSCQRM